MNVFIVIFVDTHGHPTAVQNVYSEEVSASAKANELNIAGNFDGGVVGQFRVVNRELING
jgi:hypothetical protein